jgi:hypothetical protein
VAAAPYNTREGERDGSRCVEMGRLAGGSWPGNSNEFKNLNFIQTWFAPKVTFPSSKLLDKNIGR